VDEFDLGEAQASPIQASSTLRDAVREALSLEATIEEMEEDLKVAKKALYVLKTTRIPDIMTEIQPGLEELKIDGYKVSIKDFVSGSIPKDEQKRAAAFEWLEEHEGSGLIKTEVSVTFGKSEHNVALALLADLNEQGMAAVLENSIHPQTLQAFARERIRNGEAIDTEVLGLYTGRVAQIKPVDK